MRGVSTGLVGSVNGAHSTLHYFGCLDPFLEEKNIFLMQYVKSCGSSIAMQSIGNARC